MKKKIQSGLLAIALLSFCSSGFAADFKIATVDLRKVFDNYYKTIQASLANSNSIVDRDKELNSMIDTRNKRDTDRQQAITKGNDQTVSADERSRYQQIAKDIGLEILIQNETISNFYARTELKRREDMVQHVTDLTIEITNVMNAMAKKQGYTLVLDRTALTMTGNPLVLYTSGENDLTEPLLKELNSTAPPPPAPETNRTLRTTNRPAATEYTDPSLQLRNPQTVRPTPR